MPGDGVRLCLKKKREQLELLDFMLLLQADKAVIFGNGDPSDSSQTAQSAYVENWFNSFLNGFGQFLFIFYGTNNIGRDDIKII